jgi:hypothetical protein
MRRQILRFPVGQQFKKILEDDHEWIVITDVHLKPLVMERAEKTHIPHNLERKVLDNLSNSVPEGKLLKIYNFHTHPRNKRVAPSEEDWNSFIYSKKHPFIGKKLVEVGYGVIGRTDIVLIKLPKDQDKLTDLAWDLGRRYVEEQHEYVQKKLKVKSWHEAAQVAENIDLPTQKRIMEEAYKRSLLITAKNEPEVRIKTIRKPSRITMRRRR